MTTDVKSVAPDLPLYELWEWLRSNRASGAPVVSGQRLIGVVSSRDVVRVFSDEARSAADEVALFYLDTPVERVRAHLVLPAEHERVVRRVSDKTVADAMSTHIVSVGPEASAQEIARKMLRYRIHRVLVVMHRDVLLGLISSLDLIQLVAEPKPVRAGVPRPVEPAIFFAPDLEGAPNALLPGQARVTTLRVDRETGASTLLVRLLPGAKIPAKSYQTPVQHFVLAGSYESDGQTFRAGTYRLIPGSTIPALSSPSGATLLVVHDGQD